MRITGEKGVFCHLTTRVYMNIGLHIWHNSKPGGLEGSKLKICPIIMLAFEVKY